MDSALTLNPAAPGSNPGVPKVFSKTNCLDARFIDSTSASSSGQQRLNYIDRTNLVLASGKLVLHKKHCKVFSFNPFF